MAFGRKGISTASSEQRAAGEVEGEALEGDCHVTCEWAWLAAADYRRARAKAFRIWRQETCVQISA